MVDKDWLTEHWLLCLPSMWLRGSDFIQRYHGLQIFMWCQGLHIILRLYVETFFKRPIYLIGKTDPTPELGWVTIYHCIQRKVGGNAMIDHPWIITDLTSQTFKCLYLTFAELKTLENKAFRRSHVCRLCESYESADKQNLMKPFGLVDQLYCQNNEKLRLVKLAGDLFSSVCTFKVGGLHKVIPDYWNAKAK